MSIVTAEWGADDVVLTDAPPAEVEARIRLLHGTGVAASTRLRRPRSTQSGDLTVDVGGYTARLKGRPLDLTYKEFELLKYLMQHPGRVYTRDQLLQEVWGFDYYGGTRTVDVHVRRCAPSSAPNTSNSSARCATSATASIRYPPSTPRILAARPANA